MADMSERVLLEDAVKHVYTCESLGRDCSLESLAGQLELSTERAAGLLGTLASFELVANTPMGPRLTDTGRESALRLVRTHRLWERYLADRTGIPASEWHEEAERKEHTLSEVEVDQLASRLGHPAWDPHGDPIPTAGGELPSLDRSTLSKAQAGYTFEIVHLEDEPRIIYDALLADGLDLGTRISIAQNDDTGVVISSRGREWQLDHVMAGNVTVRPLPETESADEPISTLRYVDPGASAKVAGISPACQGSQRRRLLDLGVVPGTIVDVVFESAAGDPVAYNIRGALIALRREQAGWIQVEFDRNAPNGEVL
jgi:DtxR family Mn-dependent transcriptional regulator